MLDEQLARLKVKQGRRIYPGSLVLPRELPNSMLSLPDAVTPQLLELCSDAADFSEISIFLIQSWLIRQGG